MAKIPARSNFFFLLLLFVFVGAVVIALQSRTETNPDESLSSHGMDLYGSGRFKPDQRVAFFEGRKIDVPGPALSLGTEIGRRVLGAQADERWVEIDLSEQKLTAWDGEKKFLETLVSTGLPWSPTPKGEFRIWTKFHHTKMEGGQGKYYYYLPNVPYVMFFENSKVAGYKGYGLHGTYWHDDFGTPRSHGCVNLPTPIAEKLFYWTTPDIPDGKLAMRADSDNPGTRIIIHE